MKSTGILLCMMLIVHCALLGQSAKRLEAREGHYSLKGCIVQKNKFLITVGDERVIKWDLKTGLILKNIRFENCWKMSISSDSKKISVLSQNNFTILDAETLSMQKVDSVRNISITKDGNTILYNRIKKSDLGYSSSDRTNSYVMDVSSMKVKTISFSNGQIINSTELLSIGENSLAIVDFELNKEKWSAPIDRYKYGVLYSFLASEDGATILIQYDIGLFSYSSSGKQKQINTFSQNELSKSGRFLTSSESGISTLYDLQKNEFVIDVKDSASQINISNREEFAYVASYRRQFSYVMQLNTKKELMEIANGRSVMPSVFSNDDRYFLNDFIDDYQLYSVGENGLGHIATMPHKSSDLHLIEAFDYFKDKYFVVAHNYGFTVWNVNTGDAVYEMENHDLPGYVTDIQFASEGTLHVEMSKASALVNFLKPSEKPHIHRLEEGYQRFDITQDNNFIAYVNPSGQFQSFTLTIASIDDFNKNHLNNMKVISNKIIEIPADVSASHYVFKVFSVKQYLFILIDSKIYIADKKAGSILKEVKGQRNQSQYSYHVTKDEKEFRYNQSWDSMGFVNLNDLSLRFSYLDKKPVTGYDDAVLSAFQFQIEDLDLPYKIVSDKYLCYLLNWRLYFYNTELHRVTGNLSMFDTNWICYTDDGFIDADDPDQLEGLHWLMPEYPERGLSLRLFLKDSYRPGLMSTFFYPEKKQSMQNMSRPNILLPELKFKSIQPSRFQNVLDVEIEVTSVRDTVVHVSEGKSEHKVYISGAKDLNLQRIDDGIESFADGIDSLIFDDKTASARTFKFQAQLPSSGSSTMLSAYAYNSDDVRSNEVKFPVSLPYSSLYMVGIGIDKYEDTKLNLQFTGKDVQLMTETLNDVFKIKPYCYDCPKFMKLISVGLQNKENVHWTKQNIKGTLLGLAGRTVNAVKTVNVNRAWADDVVVILLSGHGMVNEATNEFYFLPYDVGTTFSPDSLHKAISSRELATWIKYIDAKRVVVIIDACYSGASFKIPGFKSGSWNGKSFAELIDNKNVHVIAASQPDNFAIESGSIRQSLLTYALFQNGLVDKLADCNPRDNKITLKEWLQYGRTRVPELHREIMSGKVKSKAVYTNDNWKTSIEVTSGKKMDVQEPQLHYYRRDVEYMLLNLKPGY